MDFRGGLPQLSTGPGLQTPIHQTPNHHFLSRGPTPPTPSATRAPWAGWAAASPSAGRWPGPWPRPSPGKALAQKSGHPKLGGGGGRGECGEPSCYGNGPRKGRNTGTETLRSVDMALLPIMEWRSHLSHTQNLVTQKKCQELNGRLPPFYGVEFPLLPSNYSGFHCDSLEG